MYKTEKGSFFATSSDILKSKSISRVLSRIVIYLGYILLYTSSHSIRIIIEGQRADFFFLKGVAPDGVYTDAIYH